MALRKWSTDKHVEIIINILCIKLSGVTLTVKDYNNDKIIETKVFDNIGEIKTYLVKNYNVPFDEIVNKDICDIVAKDEEEGMRYEFEVS